MFDFVTKNFLTISTAAIVVASGISMLVLSAYLTVFDWNLIWLIEYSDVTKLLLVGVALVSSVLTTLINQTQDVYQWMFKNKSRIFVYSLLAIIVIGGGLSIYFSYRSGNHHTEYHVYQLLSNLAFLGIVYLAFEHHPHWKTRRWSVIANDIAMLTLALGLFGATYGYYVRDVSSFAREIRTRGQTYKDAKIIILLSHHVAFATNGKVIVVPTSEVLKIESDVSKI